MSIRQRKATTKSYDDGDTPGLLPSGSWDKHFEDDEFSGGDDDAPATKAKLTPRTKPTESIAPAPSALTSFLDNYNKFAASTFTADQGLKHEQTSLPNLEGYLSGSWAGGTWDNPLIAKVAKYIMAGSMMFYYPLEHVAYAGWQMPNLVTIDANRISAISCCFWTTYIVGDFWVSCLKWAELRKKLFNLGEMLVGKKQADDKDAVGEILEEQQSILKKIRHVKLQALRSLLFILPAVNWSLPKWATDPLLSEPIVNGLMLAEAYTCVYQSLRGLLG
eukprot:CCRYP_015185-RB/>CCRYP_015185-RB protein AED:0.43 eAED:0.45 QI:0/0/0/1/0/0.33/3/0/275